MWLALKVKVRHKIFLLHTGSRSKAKLPRTSNYLLKLFLPRRAESSNWGSNVSTSPWRHGLVSKVGRDSREFQNITTLTSDSFACHQQNSMEMYGKWALGQINQTPKQILMVNNSIQADYSNEQLLMDSNWNSAIALEEVCHKGWKFLPVLFKPRPSGLDLAQTIRFP